MNKKIALVSIILLLTPMVALGIRPASAQETIKIGVLVPYGLPQGHSYLGGAEGGALLAGIDVNASGGINVGGTIYNVEILFRNEWCYYPEFNPEKAKLETLDLIDKGCKFIVGGFRTECTWKILEAVYERNAGRADEDKVIYLISGAATDELISDTVGTNPDEYWWLFRVNPINSTMLFKNVLGYLVPYLIPRKLAPMYGGLVKYAVFVEDYEWTYRPWLYLQQPGALGPNATYVYGVRTPPGTTDFTTYLQGAKDAGARLLVIFYTLPDTANMLKQYRAREDPFLIVGVDVFAQTSLWPTSGYTAGACEYEVEMDFSGTRTPITPIAVQFWDNFVGNFSQPGYPPAWPIYTAWGAYNAIRFTIKDALEAVGSFNSTALVSYMETSEIQVLNGKARFTPQHDIYSVSYGPQWPDGYIRAMMTQWVNASTLIKQVVCPIDQEYSRKTLIPPWIYPLAQWDTNFDGKIDLKDVFATALAYGSFPGHPNWNVELDSNLDGKVDLKDYYAIATRFGQEVTPWPLP
ncbi:MAG: ABC transporter substrate-binding protein [Candidatus Bathycorpusculaceae bacterium]